MGFKHLSNINKYNSKRTVVDGIKFDSKAEAECFMYLKLLERNGQIKIIALQPKVYLTKARILYKPDFLIEEDGKRVYIDVKGMQTRDFKLKFRLWVHYGQGTLRLVQQNRFGFANVAETTRPADQTSEELEQP